uniref:Armadillo repeat-containing protein 2 n=1 Tax=Strigamia maritima TaxID=126957 RepID=T1J4M8_STRMM
MQENGINVNKPSDLPFYAVPTTSKTSAEIINEARATIRAVNTKRPYTPREENRRLFGNNIKLSSRPPSAFSLGESHYESGDFRPVSAVRLKPLDQNPVPYGRVLIIVQEQQDQDCHHFLMKKDFLLKTVDYSILLPESITVDALRKRRHSQPVITKVLCDLPVGDQTQDDGKAAAQRNCSFKVSNLTNCSNLEDQEEREKTISSNRDNVYYQTKVIPLLDEFFPSNETIFKCLISLYIDEETFCDVARQLYSTLEAGNFLGRNSTHRGSILKLLYKLLDTKNQQFQLQLARIIFAMFNNPGILFLCWFADEEIFLQSISDMNPIDDSEALVYGVGALKFLSINSALMRELSNLGCIDVITKLISIINQEKKDSLKIPEQISHVLYQLTGCLRNLAEGIANRHSFLTSGVIPHLICSLGLFQDEVDVVMNISRILSKLTIHSDICTVVTDEAASFPILMAVLEKYHKRKELMIRVAFTLGNLTAKNEKARKLLFDHPKSIDTLLELLQLYLNLSLEEGISNTADSNDVTSVEMEDAVIKLIRVVANMSIHPDVGPQVASHPLCFNHISTILSEKTKSENQELILSTLATLNNISYYSVEKEKCDEKVLQITENLVGILLKENSSEVLEVTRVLGNLTRSYKVRDFLAKLRGQYMFMEMVDVLDMMITTLDSRNKELVYTSCGVLINFMADEDKREILKNEGGIRKLIDVLKDFGGSDWQLASMVCQALWNYTTNMKHVTLTLGDVEAVELINLLEDFLNEGVVMDICYQQKVDGILQETIHDEWALIFSPVAENLLSRIKKIMK